MDSSYSDGSGLVLFYLILGFLLLRRIQDRFFFGHWIRLTQAGLGFGTLFATFSGIMEKQISHTASSYSGESGFASFLFHPWIRLTQAIL